jgi:hypothetical protein
VRPQIATLWVKVPVRPGFMAHLGHNPVGSAT